MTEKSDEPIQDESKSDESKSDESKSDESLSTTKTKQQESKKNNSTFDDPVIVRKTSPVLIGIIVIITILLDGFTRTYLGVDLFRFLLLIIEFVMDFISTSIENISIGTDIMYNIIKDNT